MGTQLPKELRLELRLLLFTGTRMCGQHRWSSIQIGFFQKTAKEDIHSLIFPFQQGLETALVSLRSYFKSYGRCIRICEFVFASLKWRQNYQGSSFMASVFTTKLSTFNRRTRSLITNEEVSSFSFLKLVETVKPFFDSVDHVIMAVSSPADEVNKWIKNLLVNKQTNKKVSSIGTWC